MTNLTRAIQTALGNLTFKVMCEARFFEWLDSIQCGVEAEYPKSKKNANQAGAK